MSDKKLENALKSVACEEIRIPHNLAYSTSELLVSDNIRKRKSFPIIIGLVFLVNIMVSLLFGGILFLIRPITIFEWVIIGSIYSTINVSLYTITFIYFDKLQNVLDAYSKGGF